MNLHKKLINMGFKVCQPHKIDYGRYLEPSKMVPDDHQVESKWVNGKRTQILTKKIHPRWKSFYKFKFTDQITIWIDSERGTITHIWLEGPITKTGVEVVYQGGFKQPVIDSKKDLIKLFPLSIQRDFILRDLLI